MAQWPRWMGADSKQGAMLDSMADLVSAGLAPAFVGMALMMEWQASGGLPGGWAWATLLPLTWSWQRPWRLGPLCSRGHVESRKGRGDVGFEGDSRSFCALFWGALLLVWSQVEGNEVRWLWLLGMAGATLAAVGHGLDLAPSGLKKWGEEPQWDLALGWLWMALLVCVILRPAGRGPCLNFVPDVGGHWLDRPLPQ